jgi:hypothetical protein
MYIFTRGSFVYHEIRDGMKTWCGNYANNFNHFRPETQKIVGVPPVGLDLCQNCAKVKARPWIGDARRKRQAVWDSATPNAE